MNDRAMRPHSEPEKHYKGYTGYVFMNMAHTQKTNYKISANPNPE